MLRLLLVALALAIPAVARAECSPQLLYSVVAETDDDGMWYVPLVINGHQVKAGICTNCAWSILGEAFVNRAGIRKRKAKVRYVAADGGRIDYLAEPESTKLGEMSLKDNFLVHAGGGDFAVFGLNLLEYFDFEIDGGSNRVSFYMHSRCGRPSAAWLRNAVELPFNERDERINAVVDIGGKMLEAGLSTGDRHTTMDLALAQHQFGVTPASPGVRRTGSTRFSQGGKVFDVYEYTLPEMTISGLRFKNVPVQMIGLTGLGINLGLHELKSLRFFVAFAQKRIYAAEADAH